MTIATCLLTTTRPLELTIQLAENCDYLELLEDFNRKLPAGSIIFKYTHDGHTYVRSVGAPHDHVHCLIPFELDHHPGLRQVRCRQLQAGESFTITISKP